MANNRKFVSKKLGNRERIFQYNIGSVIFFALFFYIVVSVLIYVTAPNIKTYKVVQGPLAQNQTYTAFAIRNEETVTASSTGYLHFFVNNKSKVSKDSVVYGISDEPWTESQMSLTIDNSVQNSIRSSLSAFSQSYNPVNAEGTSEFKYEITQKMLTESEVHIAPGSVLKSAPIDGVVVLGVDGYEDYNATMLNDSIFDSRRTLKPLNVSNDSINVGDPVYKLILDDNWSIAIKINAKQAVALQEMKSITVKFLKDNKTLKGSLSTAKNQEDQYYAVISFRSGMIRYAGDRFLDIELVTNSQSGLKIPYTALTHKQFYKIPATYLTKGEDSNASGFTRYATDSKGNFIMDSLGKPQTDFIRTEPYSYETDEAGTSILYYYVSGEKINAGDILIEPDSSSTFTVNATGSLDGVFCVNKGYAVFRRIEIIDQNSEFCIVKSGTKYGISQFDYIVEDASTVTEEEILQK